MSKSKEAEGIEASHTNTHTHKTQAMNNEDIFRKRFLFVGECSLHQ